MDIQIVAEIDARLAGVSIENSVSIPWAIESGSRAWGFPSPDSDYDCRFIYLRTRDSYLSPWAGRDVIETPLDSIFDVNGWDLAKALRLMVKGNATVTEWLRSPIIYFGVEAFRDGMLELAATVHDRSLAGRHYLHVGQQQLDKHRDDVSFKRIFYALRPAVTLRWLRENPDSGVPPMDLQTLVDEVDVANAFTEQVAELVALKALTREMGAGAVPTSLLSFITKELELATERYEAAELVPRAESIKKCDAFFLRALDEFG
ncbi:MAG: nucleotidyltransferase domain-containing protein [Salinibacterium sp.]|nr:MAG: nucleotidyltransferase domain-containing protein [Salinibacterium sp.]